MIQEKVNPHPTERMSFSDFVVFDLEATSEDPANAEIVQIAAIHPDPTQEPFVSFVDTEAELTEESPVWEITGIKFEDYQADVKAHDRSLKTVLDKFLSYTGECSLAGHNIERYDIPLLKRQLEEAGLCLPSSVETLDSLKWALLRFPTPPDGLRGYKLGNLYEYYTGEILINAHQADKDCEANRVVFEKLLEDPPPHESLLLWKYLNLKFVPLYERDVEMPTEDEALNLLQVRADVPHVDAIGEAFPAINDLIPTYFDGLEEADFAAVLENTHELNLVYPEAQSKAKEMKRILGGYRASQIEMLRLVASTQETKAKRLIQAPTGTGKTRGYLTPSHHLVSKRPDEKVIIATHTKVLQRQAYEEISRNQELGFATKAVMVKSPRDYICPAALADLLKQKDKLNEGERLAVALLSQLITQSAFDLNTLPSNWEYVPAFRETRFHIQTNPRRCDDKCPYFKSCAYQIDLKHRQDATIWITNQAWLLANESGEPKDEKNQSHFVIDEAHNLEDVATEAFSHVTDEEILRFHLRRIHDKDKRRGWLRDNEYVDETQHANASNIRNNLLPEAAKKLASYSEDLNTFIKQFGKGNLKFGITLVSGVTLKRTTEWTRLRVKEDEWIKALKELRDALKSLQTNAWLAKNLQPTLDCFKQHIDLLYERRRAFGYSEERASENYIYLSRLDQKGWSHVAQPIDLSSDLKRIWDSGSSVTLTSATLAIGNKFDYIKRILGMEDAAQDSLPESLPYEFAHIVIPSHLPEARTSNIRRFQQLYHTELKTLLPKAQRSLSLFTSTARMKEASKHLEKDVSFLYTPLTRREREDIAQSMRQRDDSAAALGTRSYMEGVDFPDLKVVNLERLPFPVPNPLFEARQVLAEDQGLDPWQHVYLPKAQLTFIQAFGRLIRDNRKRSGKGSFVLWDKRLLSASYRLLFLNSLPSGARHNFIEGRNRNHFYEAMASILELNRAELPSEEIVTESQKYLEELRQSAATVEQKATQIAEHFWEIKSLRDEQKRAIDAALDTEDLLVLLPTGFGKSLTFQIPAFIQGGLTLVVSPLIALMRDQVEALMQKDLPAAALHSMISGAEQRSIMQEVRDGRVNLLYVSPERIRKSQDFRDLLKDMGQKQLVRRFVLDEAHCLSEWGHDFRPDYKEVGRELEELVPNLPITACTATATPKVVQDLKLHLTLDAKRKVTASYDRPNISYFVYKENNDIKKLRRLTQILQHFREKNKDDSIIIYATTRKQVERLAWALKKLGIQAGAYHAGLSTIRRNEVQENFISGEVNIIVATKAFGMGIDKKNVRAVIHFSPPLSLAAYIQEAGRAGRDGEAAFAILLHNTSDWRLNTWISSHSGASRDHAEALLPLLDADKIWRGYEQSLVEAVNAQLDEEQPDLSRSDLGILLGALAESKALELDYGAGKVFILLENMAFIEPKLELLRQAGFETLKEEGNELDLSRLCEQDAETLNEFLFELYKKRKILVYANREHCVSLLKLSDATFAFSKRGRQLKRQAKEEQKKVKTYAETGECKRTFLLTAFEDKTLTTCDTCQSCDQLKDIPTDKSEPWQEVAEIPNEDLESVYKPLETLLSFMRVHKDSFPREDGYNGIGQMRIEMALQGESQRKISNGVVYLKRLELDNTFFGHLTFIRSKEIQRAIGEAKKRGFLRVGEHNGFPTYQISAEGLVYEKQQAKGSKYREAF